MKNTILFVDDEPNVLAGYQRSLRKQFSLDTAAGGAEGLLLMEKNGPYSVVVADMQMPGMNGVDFLSKAEQLAPDTVRLMLTGNADQKTAADAVNRGHIFRFLNKPAPPEELALALEAALKQYRLVTAERELLEQTLNGSAKILTDTLAMVHPEAFGRAQQLRDAMLHFARHFNIAQTWDLELAAMLAPIGTLALPAATFRRHREGATLSGPEKDMIARIPETGANLLSNIPRLESVARIIRYQQKNFDGTGQPFDSIAGEEIPIGARLLRVLNELMALESRNVTRFNALESLRRHPEVYDPKVVEAIAASYDLLLTGIAAASGASKDVSLKELCVGQRLVNGLQTKDGTLIFPAGTTLTPMHLARARNFAEVSGLHEPIRVEEPT